MAKPNTPPPPPCSWRDPVAWVMGGLLFAAVFAAYRPAATGAFIWDDDDYVALNPNLRSAHGLAEIWLHPTHSPQYYPLVFTTFWIEYQMWNGQPRGYHEIDILLHAGCAVLLWRTLRRLRTPGAFVAAMIFALHPVMVESVAWITERKNTLSLLFYLASLLAYLRHVGIDGGEQADRRSWLYAVSLTLFLCALASKTVTATLPIALMLILWWRRRLGPRDLIRLTPFFVLGVGAAITTAVIEHSQVGAAGSEWNFSVIRRLLIAGRAIWFYAVKLLWPANLAFVYSKWRVDPSSAIAWIYPVALLALVGALFAFRRRIGRGPVAALLLFVVTLTPALGLVNVYPMRYTFVADHYQYHASIALIALFAATAATLWEKLPWTTRWPRLASASVLSALLFTLTWRQSSIYQNSRALWADTVRKSPDSWMAWLNLGHAMRASAAAPDLAAAAADAYTRALQLAPSAADTHLGMAQLHIDQQQFPHAITELEKALAIEPQHAPACNLMGFCVRRTAGPAAALPWFEKAVTINPNYWPAQFNLALARKDTGHPAEAAAAFERAIAIDPTAAEAYFHLADCYRQLGNMDLAERALREVIARRPNDAEAHFSLAGILRQTGRTDEADFHRARALRLKPSLGDLSPQR